MSRRKPVDNSAAVSLFPFLAVLLCTMGALLVILVAVSRAAREAALREGAARQQIAALEDDPQLRRELEKIEQYNENLKQLRGQAEQRLRENQLRLGHLENHMRRLQNQLAVLQAAAAELDAMEEEHYDDREQAQREIERLERLIAETRDVVETLKEQVQSEKRSYALIPYEGPNGTFRRPIYIECRENELILQPEGVRVTREDLYPPYGAGNPLASALRAARDYHVQLHPQEGRSRDTEPYPLLVVRPAGLIMYDRARRAIQSSDMEFGFELAEDDWELKYPVADPKLAIVEQQAIDLARIRQKALAAAAPRAYRHAALAMSGRFELDDDGEGFGITGADGEVAASAGATLDAGGNGQLSAHEAAARSAGLAERHVIDGDAADGNATQPHGRGTVPEEGAANTGASSANAVGASGGTGDGSSMQLNAGQQVTVSTGAQPHDQPTDVQSSGTAKPRDRDWALGRKKPNAVPIRRTIQVVVRNDHIAILADDAKVDAAAPAGKRIAIEGDTVESLDRVIAGIREHIEGWGFAGDRMYWRPVLILKIGPDGQRRAEDLHRLLKESGIELREGKVANNNPQGETGATRGR
jgi:hypothetical protein